MYIAAGSAESEETGRWQTSARPVLALFAFCFLPVRSYDSTFFFFDAFLCWSSLVVIAPYRQQARLAYVVAFVVSAFPHDGCTIFASSP